MADMQSHGSMCAALYPIDTIKTRLQAMIGGGGIKALLQQGGGKALYAGEWDQLKWGRGASNSNSTRSRSLHRDTSCSVRSKLYKCPAVRVADLLWVQSTHADFWHAACLAEYVYVCVGMGASVLTPRCIII